MTQVTSENTEVVNQMASAKNSVGAKTFIQRYKQTIAVSLIVLLLILVAFLLVRMNSLGGKLAQTQVPPSAQLDINKNADSASSSLGNENPGKAAEAMRYRAIAGKFSALNARATQLKFSQSENASAVKSVETTPKKALVAPANSEMKWWNAVGEKVLTPIGNFFKDLVKIQVIDDPEMKSAASGIAMSPVAQSLLRQQLLSYLLSARQFVLLEMPKEALADLQEVRLMVVKNFASQNADTLAFIEGLTQIESELKPLVASISSAKPVEKK